MTTVKTAKKLQGGNKAKVSQPKNGRRTKREKAVDAIQNEILHLCENVTRTAENIHWDLMDCDEFVFEIEEKYSVDFSEIHSELQEMINEIEGGKKLTKKKVESYYNKLEEIGRGC